jgi:hypothetical protein
MGGTYMNIIQRIGLGDIVDSAWQHYQQHKGKDYVVKKCVPVLYFGDLEKYLSSEVRVITAGSNPSDLEFANADRRNKVTDLSFRRFKGAEIVFDEDRLDENMKETYMKSLNGYFESKDAYDWFTCLEPLLNGMDASYSPKGYKVRKGESYRRDSYKNIALHTDIYTPLPTNKQWSEINPDTRNRIKDEGISLWVDLVRYLSPDVILLSYSAKDFEEIKRLLKLNRLESGVFKQYELKKSGEKRERNIPVVETYEMDLGNRSVKVIYGSKMQRPFDSICKEERVKLGKEIRGIL